jgi:hypothetical protein
MGQKKEKVHEPSRKLAVGCATSLDHTRVQPCPTARCMSESVVCASGTPIGMGGFLCPFLPETAQWVSGLVLVRRARLPVPVHHLCLFRQSMVEFF